MPCSVDQAVFWTQSEARNRPELLAAAGKQLIVEGASAKEPSVQVDLDSVGCVERPSVEKYWVERRGMITVSARPQDLHGLVEIVRADGEVHISGVPKLLIWVVELGRGEALEYPGLDTGVVERREDPASG